MKKISLIFLICIVSKVVYASSEVDQFINNYMQRKQVPGLALLVIHQGKVAKAQGYGYANLEHQVPVKPETVFQSGSVGKQFTSAGIMILVEEGKIHLEDPISKYLGKVPDSWKNIKIRHLLTHTSGLGDYPEKFDFWKDHTEEQEIEIFMKAAPDFAPGEKWQYSNVGYMLLGVIIRKVTGKFYGDFLQERIFKPLGMNATRVITESDIVPNRAAGYRLVEGQIKNQEWVAPTLNTTADGSLYFTIQDLQKWDEALRSDKILKKTTLDQIWTPVSLNNGKTEPYGFAWRIADYKGHKLIEHGGAWQGFTTHISRYVDDQLTIAVLTNLQGGTPGYVAHAVAGFYNEDLRLPKRTRTQLDPQILKAYEGQYKLESGTEVAIRVSGDHLQAQVRSSKLDLLPESESSFFIEDSESTITFVKPPSGEVTELIWNSGGEESRAVKVKPSDKRK